jgi:plasmid maintenance system antidote protein VapI
MELKKFAATSVRARTWLPRQSNGRQITEIALDRLGTDFGGKTATWLRLRPQPGQKMAKAESGPSVHLSTIRASLSKRPMS